MDGQIYRKKERFYMNIEVNPFIMLEGTAREAISFYQESLGANLLFMQTVGKARWITMYPCPKKIWRVLPTPCSVSVKPQCS